MNRKLVLVLTLTLLIGVLSVAFNVKSAKASAPIFIRADGSIYPSTSLISTFDNVTYTLTGNITFDNRGIMVERDNIVVDGDGYVITGSGIIGWAGIALGSRSNVTVRNMAIENFYYGIWLDSSSGNTLSGNNITNNDYGIDLLFSSTNTLFGNNVTANNYCGIELYSSTNNNLSGNDVTANNEKGIDLSRGTNNTLSGNVMGGNRYNFGVDGFGMSEYLQSVDTSNLVDGKPVYYFVNQSNLVVNAAAYPKIGYLGFANCVNVTVQGLNLTGNGQGLLLSLTSDSKITDNNVANNKEGIRLFSSSGNTLFGNNVTANNGQGVWLGYSSGNILFGNNVTANNYYGIWLDSSSNNTLLGNNIGNNGLGVEVSDSSDNILYHNNFVANTQQVSSASSANVWDDGYPSGGNYWSDYHVTDMYSGSYQNETGGDGIGDTAYVIDGSNKDNYPLMGMFSEFNWVGLSAPERRIQIICNSTISNLIYNGTAISFNVTGDNGTNGFCRIQIPKVFMNTTFAVYVNGTEIAYTLLPFSNENITYLYFNYTHSTEQVIIIPEFPSFLILPLFFIATLLGAIFCRKELTRAS